MTSTGDPSSNANISDYTGGHLNWLVETVDFDTKELHCISTQNFTKNANYHGGYLYLDTRTLVINKVTVNGKEAKYQLQKPVQYLGQPLEIQVPKDEDNIQVSIDYKTSPSASAIQWMKGTQTDSGSPFLFTQCQAIHARSLLPCQDTPGKKFTYNAKVKTPAGLELTALMSAIDDGVADNEFSFKQTVPIPSYLIALAIGNLECRQIGAVSNVWCEKFKDKLETNKQFVDICQEEFSQVDDMIKAGVDICGEYVWKRYDILVLPASFPYGGMENPCLTFATPTIVARDKSLVNVVAHEITHSWTGNLVSNFNWEQFWLNEGFTRFVEGKIMQSIQTQEHGGDIQKGIAYKEFMAIIGLNDLKDSVDSYISQGKSRFTKLVPSLVNEDPDDTFSSVPYEKGYTFLYYIENLLRNGEKDFNPFLKHYISKYARQSIFTIDFKETLYDFFKDSPDLEALKQIDWDGWMNSEGMPFVDNKYDDTYAQATKCYAEMWIAYNKGAKVEITPDMYNEFTTLQKIDFLTKLFQQDDPADHISLDTTKKLESFFNLRTETNAEIAFQFFRLTIRVQWEEIVKGELTAFMTSVGRMKFCRPLYQNLYKFAHYKRYAQETFLKHEDFYHPIAAQMIRQDLGLE